MAFIEKLFQTYLWLRIAISPTLFGAILGLIICGFLGNLNVVILSVPTVLGFVVGAFWAERVRKTTGLGMFFRDDSL